ncbi:MAG: ArsR family transcriptional regulator [Methanoregula sp.]|jgi:flavodoxin|nr:ArsR family transcriptional regulator [Methanoregula sp.]
MKPAIIFTSYTGTTHNVAEQVRKACGGNLIEVKSWDLVARLLMYMARHSPDIQVRDDGAPPGTIDVSNYDFVVIGTPVWMGKPPSGIRKTIAALTGCSGKPAVIFATCGEDPGTTLSVLSADIEAKGMTVAGQLSLSQKEIEDGTGVNALVGKIREQGSGS